MKIYATLATLVALTFAGTTEAALRTFTINSSSGGVLSVAGSPIFEYTDGAFATFDGVGGSELITPLVLMHSGAPGVPFTLYQIDNLFNQGRYLFSFRSPDALTLLTLRLDGEQTGSPFAQPSGADLPDGTDPISQINLAGMSTGSASITIGTAAIPEPSAFAFGALALTVVGLGRWLRKSFFASAAAE